MSVLLIFPKLERDKLKEKFILVFFRGTDSNIKGVRRKKNENKLE